MANRFRNRNYGRGDYGNRSDYGRNRYRNDYENERYGGGSPRFGGYDYDREENYFGGGNMSYGQGYTGMNFDRGYSSYDRDFDEDEYTRYNQPSRAYTGFSGRSGGRNYDRENYYGGRSNYDDDYDRGDYGGYYGSDYDENRSYDRGYYQRNRYGNDRSYGSEYTGSERGYGRGNRGRYDYDREDRGFFDKAADEVASWFGDEEAERRRRLDERQNYQGYRENHRGRGPKNYTRSDDRIKEDINDRLTDDYYLDASDIDVEVNNGEVTLTGTVDSRYAKRRAEDIAEDISGVTHCENRIRVNESFYGRDDSSLTDTTTGTSITDTTDTTTKSRSKTA